MAKTYSITRKGKTSVLEYGPFVDGEGGQHSASHLDLWSEAELAAIGVHVTGEYTPVPQVVSRMQARKALRLANLLETFEEAVAAGSVDLQDYYADASHFHRNHPELVETCTAQGLTSEQVDQLFILAGALV